MDSGLADARSACAEHRWGDAWRLYSEASGDLDVDDLDHRATAAYMIGHDEEGFDLWGRAHLACVDDGSVHRAAHFGVRLALALNFKGDLPRSRGWVDRTARLLEEAAIDCVEQGYLEHALGMARLFETGDVAAATAHFERAGKVAARFAHRELATISRIAVGRMRIFLGDVAEGLGMLDEAVVSIEAGELSPFATGDMWCTVIDACEDLSDVVRTRAWTTSMRRWCDTQQELVLYRGHCLVHGASTLRVLGRWREGLDEARAACERLAGPLPAILGSAAYLEADLLRLLGDDPAAEAAYLRASELGRDPQPGLAQLRLAQGDVAGAEAMVRRAVAETEEPPSRARLLGPYVEILLAAGDVGAARAASEELRGIAGELGSTMLGALAARAVGSVALAAGDPTGALQELRRAFLAFRDLDAHHDAAVTRFLIAAACEAIGDRESASMEDAAARRAVESFCLEPDVADGGPSASAGGLTRRERDVLGLLASGKTNRLIGEALFISEKTVATHVSHIFTKLGVGSRAAATAYAYDHDLI